MTLHLNITINVEPRHGVAHDMFYILLNRLIQAEFAFIWEFTTKGGVVSGF